LGIDLNQLPPAKGNNLKGQLVNASLLSMRLELMNRFIIELSRLTRKDMNYSLGYAANAFRIAAIIRLSEFELVLLELAQREWVYNNYFFFEDITDLINIFWLSIYLFTFKTHLKRSYGRFIQWSANHTHRICAASFV
jgi:hypothetical protein